MNDVQTGTAISNMKRWEEIKKNARGKNVMTCKHCQIWYYYILDQLIKGYDEHFLLSIIAYIEKKLRKINLIQLAMRKIRCWSLAGWSHASGDDGNVQNCGIIRGWTNIYIYIQLVQEMANCHPIEYDRWDHWAQSNITPFFWHSTVSLILRKLAIPCMVISSTIYFYFSTHQNCIDSLEFQISWLVIVPIHSDLSITVH